MPHRKPPVSPSLDPRVLEGIELINSGEYFLAHEAIESAWLEEFGANRKLYQGLIQVAVALHHLGQHNTHGALKLYRTAREHLLPYGPLARGVRLDRLLADLDRIFVPIIYSPGALQAAHLRIELERGTPESTP